MVLTLFAYFATVSIVAGVMTVAFKNPVHCGLALLTLLLHVAGLFVLLNAEFLFAVQIDVINELTDAACRPQSLDENVPTAAGFFR